MTFPTQGQSITFRKTLSVAEQGFFTGISGNLGGLYVDRTKAKAQGLADMAVFELAAGALFTTALARLAGPEWRISEISFRFLRPMVLAETLAATATVTEVGESLAFTLTGTAGDETVIEGAARMARVCADV
ncbi:thioesterase superfamily protein [Rhodobacter aestuarii]|uniref:Thioesterase superfamily protein n=1 Tax=Rhodobacter aestuarii TaxID=453582 RepID=A0A1N7JZG6_9RHOB|nr:hotdog domain-containing protein [Rhodobacter aestuarii]PTV95923.1 thioesterase superfamily protein [Rhodobacter aestuarii]SIS54733.1 Thioesterase superfamily protein [Rhodobacter aestuarii]